MPYTVPELMNVITDANKAYETFRKAKVEVVKSASTYRMLANLHQIMARLIDSDNYDQLIYFHDQAIAAISRAIRAHSDIIRIDYLINLPV